MLANVGMGLCRELNLGLHSSGSAGHTSRTVKINRSDQGKGLATSESHPRRMNAVTEYQGKGTPGAESPISATQETVSSIPPTGQNHTKPWSRSTKPRLVMMLCHQGSTCPELECSTTKALMSYLQTHLPTGSHSVGTYIEPRPLCLLPYSSVAGAQIQVRFPSLFTVTVITLLVTFLEVTLWWLLTTVTHGFLAPTH